MNLSTALKPLFSRNTLPVTIGNTFGMFGATTKNGVSVNSNTALTISSFYNGIEIISNDYAKLPKSVFQKTNDSRLRQPNHPVNYLIAKRPNNFMTAFMFDKMQIQYAVLKGNSYAEIIRNNAGSPIQLQLIDQDDTPVTVKKFKGKLYYQFDGRIVMAENMIHIPGFSFNGITGISVITHAANSLGIDLSSREYATDYYNTKGVGVGVLTTGKDMLPDAKIRYSEALGKALTNADSQFPVAVVDEGGSFSHIKITPQEAQFLQTQKNGIAEVARWLNVPVHKLKSLDNVNNSITENLEIQHLQDSMLPWVRKFEQELDVKLFSQADLRNGFYIKVNINALLRADTKTKTDYLTKGIMMGWLTRNEARALEEFNPIDGLSEPLTPVNTQTLEQIDKNLKDE